ncbi:hypothetical protein LJR251_000615 [Rhizobium rhizogenes]|uniref:hypothetical protein n=1 Tax=Rhizobium rhizogenes TaxID=359 RepID=UPI0006455172|nr:hypothetical protein [Rhizobium rhizogenes]
MNEVIDQIAAKAGIAPDVAEKAVGTILGFLQRESPDGPVTKMIAAIPGASDLVAQYGSEEASGGGLLGGLLSAVGGGGGIMALGQQLMSSGLSMGEVTSLAKATIEAAREHAGNDVVDKVVGSVPGLSQFV